MRRRGFTPEAIRELCRRVGVAKFDGVNDFALLEHCVRDHLNKVAPRVMAVLRPLKVVITNWDESAAPGRVEWLEAVNNPEDPSAGTRQVPFAKEIYIERDDFMEDPPRKFFRLAPGREVRLRYAYWIKCHDVIKDPATGEITELHCTYDPATRGGDAPPPDAEGNVRKVKATLHWVSGAHAVDAEVRLYDHLFTAPDPEDVGEGQDYRSNLNPDSLEVLTGCKLEPNWQSVGSPWSDGIQRFQFERLGYFTVDADSVLSEAGVESEPSSEAGSRRPASDPGAGRSRSGASKLVFNRTVTLKDTWAKIAKKNQAPPSRRTKE
jgi:glutaminyl-tRNA synthetase